MAQIDELVKDIATLKADVKQSSQIHSRLDDAIVRLTDISSGIKSMLAVHDEKIRRVDSSQEDLYSVLEERRREWEIDLKELHSRISTQGRELREAIQDTTLRGERQHREHAEAIDQVNQTLSSRVGVLEKWRWLIIGGAIIIGFIIQNMDIFS
jgi:DNA repair exonuclease SbcCD ATPase subunit